MTRKAIIDLAVAPGIYTEETDRGAKGRWKYGDKVRFRYGLPEKIGGWQQVQPMFLGVARDIHDWAALDGSLWTAIGTDWKLYLWQDETLYDITPIRRTASLTDPFTTVINSSIVTVEDAGHGAIPNDFVTFSGATAVGGLTISGEYQILSTTFSTYTIDAGSDAISSGTGGGTVGAEYQINTGLRSGSLANGYGIYGYGADDTSLPLGEQGYDTPRPTSQVSVAARTWSLDNWGEDLIACPFGKSIYWWDRTSGAASRAIVLPEAPPNCNKAIISQRDRHLFAMGSTERFSQTFDPLLIRWCSQEDFSDWIPTDTNTSGDLRLYRGSAILSAVKTRGQILVFTDESVHSVDYLGGFDVYGVNVVGENVSILGPNAVVATDYRVFFMGEGDFFMYDGVLRVLPCDVRNEVYGNLNVAQKAKSFGGLNREFNEVWFFYPGQVGDQNQQQDTAQTGSNPFFLYENEGINIDVVSGDEATAEGAGLTLTTNQAKFGDYSVQGDGTTVDNAISWSGSQYSLGQGTWTIHGWVYLPTGSYSTGATPYGICGNQLPQSSWGGTTNKGWNIQVVPNIAGDFQYGFYYTSASGNSSSIGTAGMTTATFPLDNWNWFCAQRSAGDRVDVWMNGNHIANGTIAGTFDDDLGQFLIGIGNVNGWGGASMRNWPGYIDNIVATRDVLFNTTGQNITVPTTTPTAGFPSPEVNRYVMFNYEENTWSLGSLVRTAWADRSPVLEKPYAASTDGYLYQHETGVDANGAAMTSYLESYDMELPEAGEYLVHVDQLIPDFLTLTGSVDVTLNGRKYPQDTTLISKGPYSVAPGTRKVSLRFRGRQVSLDVRSDAVGDEWRMGQWRARVGAHGKR